MNSNVKQTKFNLHYVLSKSDYIFLIILITGLITISRFHYLLFHSLVEISIIMTGFLSFAFTWHLRRFEFGPLLAIGILLGCTSIINIFHMLAFKGMGVFAADANLPTQLWIASRYLFSLVILLTLIFSKFRFTSLSRIFSHWKKVVIKPCS